MRFKNTPIHQLLHNFINVKRLTSSYRVQYVYNSALKLRHDVGTYTPRIFDAFSI